MNPLKFTTLIFGLWFAAFGLNAQNTFPTAVNTPVGIGTVTPTERLQVVGGHIDLNSDDRAYMINRQPVLWYNQDPTNIYVGVQAGNSTSSGVDNTFIGNLTGNSNTIGNQNTFVGHSGGFNNTSGDNNAFLGESSGFNNTQGFQNTFIGHQAGQNNTTGDNNICIGNLADVNGVNQNNSAAIGTFSLADCSDCMILGSVANVNLASNNTRAGIGTNNPNANAVLHLNRNTNVDVVTRYTNPNTAISIWNGFEVGVDAAGMGVLRHATRPIEFTTRANDLRVTFTSWDGSAHTFGSATGPGPGTDGEGIRIHDRNNLGGDLDLWTSTANQTHIVWGPNGRIQGINDRFEIQGDFTDGLWFNNDNVNGGTFFNHQGVEHGRIGTNEFWRIGANAGGVNAATRLEVVDATAPQLRLSQTSGISFTEFQTTNTGNLLIGSTGGRVGINFTSATSPAPQQTLDVNGTAAIRTVAQNNSGTQLLVWNSTGNGLIQYRDVSSLGLGTVGACATGTTNRLTKWCNGTDVTNSIIYDNGTNVGIRSTSSLTNPQAKLHVINDGGFIASVGGYMDANAVGTTIINMGSLCTAENAPAINVGVAGIATYPSNFPSPAIILDPSNPSTSPTFTNLPYNAGVVGKGQGSLFNYGGVFEGNSCGGFGFSYGIYATAKWQLTPLTACAPGPAGYFNGDLVVTGTPHVISDAKFKDSVQAVSGAIAIISQLQPKSFVYKTDSFPYMGMPLGNHYGFIAQQVDTVLPSLVGDFMQPPVLDTGGIILQDTMSFEALNYEGLIPLAIAGIQEQQAIIDSLKDEQVTAEPEAVGDTNRLVKWSFTDRELTNSLVYDDGNRVGIPAVKQGSYLNVENTGTDTVAVNATSTNPNTTAVVNAVYTVDSGESNVVAVRGYSKYLFEPGQHDGIGGAFEGGKWGVYSLASGANNQSIGLVGESKNATNRNYGVMGVSRSITSADNFGVQGIADSSEEANGGVIGVAEYVNATSVNIGLSGFAAGSGNENIAGEFEAWDTTGVNYGIFAYANGTAPNAYAGYFDGDVHATGTITWTSDANLKENVKNVDADATLAKIMRLQPKTYTFRAKDYPYLSLPNGNQYGLLAQEVQQVFPELVTDVTQPERRDRNGNVVSPKLEYKGLNYAGLIPILVGAVKQQQTKIDSLSEVITNRLDALEARLNGCCGTGSANKTADENAATPHQLTVELSSTQVVILEQNVPNPFAEQTSISYFIPENITNAQLVFTDILGNNIKQVEVKSGYGTVTVFASNLTSGQYSYSLVIDGKVVETKRMVKTK